MTNYKFLGRGIHNKAFIESLNNGNLKKMLMEINQDNELDIQVRNNYLNVYYKGGNIARVKSENSIEFDMFYFYLEMKITPKKEIEKNEVILKKLKTERDLLVKKFKERNYKDYFIEAKEIMDKWLERNPKPERMEQHQLSIANRFNKSDYTIIDLEYQVSTKSDFACTFIPKGKVAPKKPRFDIIAVNKLGELCVIELKKGTGALKDTSGLKEHWDCYQKSIAQNYKSFVFEMEKLLEQKQILNLIDSQLKIKSPIPKFMFAYSYDDKTSIESQDEIFNEQYKKTDATIHVIRLKDGIFELLDS
jgi:hypothetical protein